jgi:ATP-binding cassette, subfamily C (CFTR/MRP), member 1
VKAYSDNVNLVSPEINILKDILHKVDTQAAIARRTGDKSVYKYYLTSAGWKGPIIFVISMSIFGFCSVFPCETRPLLRRKPLLTKNLVDLWLAWWAGANEMAPNSDLGKWLGGYSAFSIGAMISLMVGTR